MATPVPTAAGRARGGRHRAVPPRPAPTSFRPDVQGLRALAVSLVVVYHLWPGLVPGGYVGVDVFFVISGFLITGQLARTVRRTGRVGFADFYARRARRLLPAAAVVLVATWLASRAFLPTTQLAATAEQVRASALYFQNWVLAGDAVSYLKSDDPPTPVQHFWSLSVEEQFYLGWPLLFLLAIGAGVLVARRARSAGGDDATVAERRAGTTRRVMFLLAVAVVVASFWYSVHETAANPAAAYFITTTRIWELAAGAALALLGDRIAARIGRVGVLAWAGLVLIVVSAFVIDDSSAFPGSVAALPVAGALLVIAAGSASAKLGPSRLLSLRPAVFVGDISYALYLWHWPLIVIWTERSGGDIGRLDGPPILIASVLLAWLTKLLVEDRIRLAGFFAGHRWRSLATVATAAVPVLLATMFIASEPGPYRPELDAARPGAAVLQPSTAGSTAASSPSAPASSSAADDRASVSSDKSVPFAPPVEAADEDTGAYARGPGGCQALQSSHDLLPCTFGDTENPVSTIALVGDSVAGQWFPALNAIAQERHWKLLLNLHSACPWSATMTVTSDGKDYTSCHDWGKKLTASLLKEKPDVVLTSARPTLGTSQHNDVDETSWQQIATGAVTYWDTLRSAGIPVVPLIETPELGKDVPECLARTRNDFDECSVPRSKALAAGTPMAVAAEQAKVRSVAVNDLICGSKTCRPVVGNVLVYRDKHHITRTFMLTLTPFVEQRLLATGVFG